MFSFIKEHPYMTAIGVFVVGVILVVLFSSGGSDAITATAPDNSSATAANTQLAMAQLAAQVETSGIQAQAGTNAANIAAQLELGKLQVAQQGQSDQLAAQVAQSTITAQSQTQQLMATLQAQVATQGLVTQEKLAQLSSATSLGMAAIQAEQMSQLSETYAQMLNSQIQGQIEQQRIAANVITTKDTLAAQTTQQQQTYTYKTDTKKIANEAKAREAERKRMAQQRAAIEAQIANANTRRTQMVNYLTAHPNEAYSTQPLIQGVDAELQNLMAQRTQYL